MIFDRIYGHKKQIAILRNAISSDRLSHAYLFVGIEGVGKRTVALAFANALNCLNGEGEGCDHCTSCRKIANSNHPDVRLVVPKKDNILIDQIRELKREMSLALYEARYRVVIIDQAEKMNPAAANCLLKILEEPPMRTVIVLVCRALHLLLPTIISRCQKIVFNPLPSETLAEAIVALGKAEEKRAITLARSSEGSLGKAFELLESPFVEDRKTLLRRFLVLSEADISELLDLAEASAKNKDEFRETLEAVWTLLRDLLIWRHFQDKKLLVNIDLCEEIGEGASLFRTEAIISMMEIVGETQIQLERNINTRLLAERLFLEMRKTAQRQKAKDPAGGFEKSAPGGSINRWNIPRSLKGDEL